VNIYSAAVLTISDKTSRGERVDTSGPAIVEMLRADGWSIVHATVVSDDIPLIKRQLLQYADEMRVPLVITTGGTGFTKRDNTPEATSAVIERPTPGFSETMRAESFKLTPNGILSRGVSGIRGDTLFINLPGSKKAAVECLGFILPSLKHAFKMLAADSVEHTESTTATVLAVCLSEKTGEQKTPQESIELRENHGVVGDAHAGEWHRQVSLLSKSSVDKLQATVDIELTPGIFAENILIDGIEVMTLPIGTKISLGDAVLEVTQIGKECHSDCVIRQKAGDCVMPREGVFAKVLHGGIVRAGDVFVV